MKISQVGQVRSWVASVFRTGDVIGLEDRAVMFEATICVGAALPPQLHSLGVPQLRIKESSDCGQLNPACALQICSANYSWSI